MGGVALISAGCPGGGQARWGAAGHPFARGGGGHDGVRGVLGRRGQSDGATTPRGVGVMTCTTRADQLMGAAVHVAATGMGCRARTWWSRSA